MTEKHIQRIKRKKDEDEGGRIIKTLFEKMDIDEIMDVQDRAITFKHKPLKTNEEDYKVQSTNVKDGFGNTAQYIKFVNANLDEKKSRLKRFNEERERFEREVASLKPNVERTKSDLDQINYNEIKPDDVRKVLAYLESERDTIKLKVEHFSTQITQARKDLAEKNEQMEEIKSELKVIEKKESSKGKKIEKEEDAIKIIQKELTSFGTKSESEKIFGAINSLVVLLNSKNQATLNELDVVKTEFNKMKQEYEKVMRNLKLGKT